jgi:beta-1,4-mannosyl-glycoprotein beta-1,4-N-acetylglucosaminyltransferase
LEPSNEYFLVENNHRREFTKWVLENVKDEYVGILGDCDEIVSSDIINHIESIEGIKSLDMKMFYFTADNWSKYHPWKFPKIFKSSELQFFDFQSIRIYNHEDYISDMGWHFSCFGGIERVIDKLKSYAHTEFNNENHTNYEILYNRLKNREDYLGREEYPCVEFSLDNFPPDLREILQNNTKLFVVNSLIEVSKFS